MAPASVFPPRRPLISVNRWKARSPLGSRRRRALKNACWYGLYFSDTRLVGFAGAVTGTLLAADPGQRRADVRREPGARALFDDLVRAVRQPERDRLAGP